MTQAIIGREAELETLRALVNDARAGSGGSVLIVGHAGVGKSTLLDASAAEASAGGGVSVIRVVGVEAERDLPFAGLSMLVTPLLQHRAALTPAQQCALDTALGLAEGPPPGRMVLGGALLGLVSARADGQPLLVVVDDLQWVDLASAEIIVFAARRLQAERVAVIAASRPLDHLDGEGLGRVLRSLPTLDVTGLPVAECHRLLPHAAPGVTAALAAGTGGNPLAMLEAAALLDADVRAGSWPMVGDLPPTSAADTYREVLSTLSPGAREAGRVLAHAGRAPAHVVHRALTVLSITAPELEAFERTGLGRLSNGRVSWRHPLARSASAEGPAERTRRVHAVLAECWASVPQGRPQWAWHMSEAVSGPDPMVAEALAEVAQLSAARDASIEAADAWERAAELTVDAGRRRELLGLAARAAFRGGSAVRAARLYDGALTPSAEAGHEDERSVLLHERGRVEHGLGRPSTAYSLLMDAARAGAGQRRVWAASEAVLAAMYARRADLATAAAAAAVAAHDTTDPVQVFLAQHAEGATAGLAGDATRAHELMEAARSLLLDQRLLDDNPELVLWAVNSDLFEGGPVPPLPQYVEAAVAALRETGELMWSPRVVRLVGLRDHARGAWDRAYASFVEATELSRLSGQRTQVAEGLLHQAWIEAARGRRSPCWEHTEEAAQIVNDLEVRWLTDDVWAIRGLLFLTLDEPQSAAESLSLCREWSPDVVVARVEALVRSGREDEARAVLTDQPGDVTTPALAAARCLLDRDGPAARRLLQVVDAAPSTFDAARWRLIAGSVLRRAGARREAREQLRLAHEVFEGLGATAWSAQARSELQASGATLRRGPEGPALTAGELRVAQLVAQGRSNKEAAAALFLSTKTVEFHLGRVYQKLGVTNRTALGARLREAPGTLSPR